MKELISFGARSATDADRGRLGPQVHAVIDCCTRCGQRDVPVFKDLIASALTVGIHRHPKPHDDVVCSLGGTTVVGDVRY